MIGNGVVNVRWDKAPDNGAAIKGYAVTATPEGGGSTVTGTLTGETTALLEGVRNGVTYTVKVVATNKAGEGAPGRTTVRTWAKPAAVEPLGRENIVGTAFERGRVEYRWRAPTKTGGEGVSIDHYRVSYGSIETTTKSTAFEVGMLTGGDTSPTIKVAACTVPEPGSGPQCSEETPIDGTKVITAPGSGSVDTDRDVGPATYRMTATAPSGARLGGDEKVSSKVMLYLNGVLAEEKPLGAAEKTTFESPSDGVTPGTVVKVVITTTNSYEQSATAEDSFTVKAPADPGAPDVTAGTCVEQKACVTWTYDQPSVFWKFQKFIVEMNITGTVEQFDSLTDPSVRAFEHPGTHTQTTFSFRVGVVGKRFGQDITRWSEWKDTGKITQPLPPETTDPETTDPETNDPPTNDQPEPTDPTEGTGG